MKEMMAVLKEPKTSLSNTMFTMQNADNTVFTIGVKSVLKLYMITNFVSAGVLFCQASRLY
jgi:hypothetical protein